MARNEGKISKNEFNPTLKTEYETSVTNALNAKVTIGTGTLGTTNKTIIPAINELKSTDTTIINSIGTLSTLKTTAKGSTVAAINELFQSGVDLQNIAKSALNAAGISYSNDQLKTLVNTMGSNLYTQDMKNRLVNAITNAGGSANANDFNSIIDSIGQLHKSSTPRTISIHSLNDWSYSIPNPENTSDTIGYIDLRDAKGTVSARIQMTQWNSNYNYDWYFTGVRFYNDSISYIKIPTTVGFYDGWGGGNAAYIEYINSYDKRLVSSIKGDGQILETYMYPKTSTEIMFSLFEDGNTHGYGRKVARGFTIIYIEA